jgi:hypothetical protein
MMALAGKLFEALKCGQPEKEREITGLLNLVTYNVANITSRYPETNG